MIAVVPAVNFRTLISGSCPVVVNLISAVLLSSVLVISDRPI
jgi:hypothetical protein